MQPELRHHTTMESSTWLLNSHNCSENNVKIKVKKQIYNNVIMLSNIIKNYIL